MAFMAGFARTEDLVEVCAKMRFFFPPVQFIYYNFPLQKKKKKNAKLINPDFLQFQHMINMKLFNIREKKTKEYIIFY